jgi:hypothetical protein
MRLRLTPDSLSFVKRALRAALPQVRSQHLSEALAAALGYRTHAALREALRSAPLAAPPLPLVDAAAFARRLRALGYDLDPAGVLEGAVAAALPMALDGADRRRIAHGVTGLPPLAARSQIAGLLLAGRTGLPEIARRFGLQNEAARRLLLWTRILDAWEPVSRR